MATILRNRFYHYTCTIALSFFFLQELTILHQMLMLRSVIIADHKREWNEQKKEE